MRHMQGAALALLWCIRPSEARHLDFIEIGTADFDTLAQLLVDTDAVGISVEPVKSHLDALPDGGPARRKVHAAITEEDGWADLFTVRQEYVEPFCTGAALPALGLPYCLPWWFRAIASMHQPSDLVEVHAGPEMVQTVSVAVRVRTMTYAQVPQVLSGCRRSGHVLTDCW
eukprot:TRINITY_DN58112_c0_g1_i1.p1 TRINITY_DN58112_c0_g1~~TRINITY_DN58112_c0_g1_i1.p1  ORF type:complete len:171 (-),score=24.91 TRINITY_DN58112_c0_g1_i1:75-587(-)